MEEKLENQNLGHKNDNTFKAKKFKHDTHTLGR